MPTASPPSPAVPVPPAGRTHLDGAYDKLYVRREFPAFPLDLLPPYRGATPAQFEAVRAAALAALSAVPPAVPAS